LSRKKGRGVSILPMTVSKQTHIFPEKSLDIGGQFYIILSIEVDKMDEKILELLAEMNKELKGLKLEMKESNTKIHNLKLETKESNTEIHNLKLEMKESNTEIHNLKLEVQKSNIEIHNLKLDTKEFKTEMHNRFDKLEAKLDGVGDQFERTNESRIDEFEFIADKVNKLEKEIYFLKKQE